MSRLNFAILATSIFRGPEGDPPAPTPTPTPPAPTQTPTPTPPAPLPSDTDKLVQMRQSELNRLMAENKKTLQQKNTELAQQLREAIDSGRLTQEQAQQYEARITELETEYKTKEEQSNIQLKDLQNKYENDTKRLTDKAKTWESRFDNMLIENQILEAGAKYKAFNPSQLIPLLKDKARRVEELSEGKPTGRYGVKIKFTGEREGKPVELDLTPDETVKMMSEMPTLYGNLFISKATGGLGGSNGTGSNKVLSTDLSKLSMEDYKKNRDQYLKAANEGTKAS